MVDKPQQGTLSPTAPPPLPQPPAATTAKQLPLTKPSEAVGGVPKVGQFGGQQMPLSVTPQRGPRFRALADGQSQEDALKWYAVITDVPQPSRFSNVGTCRECAWQGHAVSRVAAEALVREHALHVHVYSA